MERRISVGNIPTEMSGPPPEIPKYSGRKKSKWTFDFRPKFPRIFGIMKSTQASSMFRWKISKYYLTIQFPLKKVAVEPKICSNPRATWLKRVFLSQKKKTTRATDYTICYRPKTSLVRVSWIMNSFLSFPENSRILPGQMTVELKFPSF